MEKKFTPKIQNLIKLWEKNIAKEEKEELKSLDDKTLYDSFYKELEFGTGGIRGIMGLGINRLNVYIVKKVILGYSKYLKNNLSNKDISIAISYDNRNNSKLFAEVATEVLAAQGIKTYITENLRPTPYLSFMVREFKTNGGIMITASHNPKEYNGIKLYDENGCQMVPKYTNEVIKKINEVTNYFEIKAEKNELINIVDESFDEKYLNEVLKLQLNENQAKPYTFLYTPLHGTGGTLINELANKTGYKIKTVEEQMVVDGNFSKTKSSNPEDEEAYELALKRAMEINADAVLATDPDADRLGIIVRHNDSYIFLNGNQTVSIQLYYLLTMKNKLDQKLDGIVYFSHVTTPILRDICNKFKVEYEEVLTGFKFIGDAIENNKKPFLFGAEESYGSLALPFVRDKDAIQAVLMLIEMVTYYKNNKKSLYDVLLEVYETFGFYAEKTVQMTYRGEEGALKIKKIMDHYYSNVPKALNNMPKKIENYFNGTVTENNETKKANLPLANVVKFIYSDVELTFRPSGTEPKIKIYLYVKDISMLKAENRLEEIVGKLNQEINQI